MHPLLSYLCVAVLCLLLSTSMSPGAAAAANSDREKASCDQHGHCVNFPTFRYMLHRYFPLGDTRQTQRLDLVAAGVRRQKSFLLETDLYTVGLYLSFEKEEQLYHRHAQQLFHMIDLALSIPTNPSDDHVSMSIVLTFQRALDRQQAVQALTEGLSAPMAQGSSDTARAYADAIQHFTQVLQDGLRDKAMVNVKDEVVLTFLGRDNVSVNVYLADHLVGRVDNALLRQQLAEMYIGEDSVAKDVHITLKNKF